RGHALHRRRGAQEVHHRQHHAQLHLGGGHVHGDLRHERQQRLGRLLDTPHRCLGLGHPDRALTCGAGLPPSAPASGGGAILEFAILAPVLFAIVFGFLEMGRMFYIRQALEYATEEAARYYMLNPTIDSSSVTTQLRNTMAGGMGPSVTVVYADTASC